MSKMGQELEDRLNANKYELKATCADYDLAIGMAITAHFNGVSMATIVEEILLPVQIKGRQVLAKIEGDKQHGKGN